MRICKLYITFLKNYLKSKTEYKFSFFLDIISPFIIFVGIYLSVWIILWKFKRIGDWNLFDVLFMYNINLFCWGVSGLFLKVPMLELGGLIAKGEFDSYLLRPVNSLLHLVLKNFDHQSIGIILLSALVFIVYMPQFNISWTIDKLVFFPVILFSGTLIHIAIMIIAGALNFWFIKAEQAVNMTIYGVKRFIDYPIFIFNRAIQFIITFIIPYAFVNFYPSQYLLDKREPVIFTPIFIYASPIVSIILFVFSLVIWNAGIKKYQSTGS
jgi:ABC-2 type transport system permease protein